MHILFLHDNFPAQFGIFGTYLVRKGWRVTFGTQRNDARLPGIEVFTYKPHRAVNPKTHPYLRSFEKAVLTGQAVARTGFKLRDGGLRPDIVVAHSGWGPSLFVKEVWPDAKVVGYYEWYYQPRGVDVVFLNKENPPRDQQLRARARNAPILMDLAHTDWGIAPTRFQRDQFPELFHERLTVQHDGVDTEFLAPNGVPPLHLPNLQLPEDAELITYATRGMEPYRGFPQFMAALAQVQKRRPRAHGVIAGTDRVAYGNRSKDGKSYKEKALAECELDMARTHFVGLLPRSHYRSLLQSSSVHVYLTVPFVLSWSMLEAMSIGCLLVASDTDPVREMVEDGHNGLLVDFFDADALAERICEALEGGRKFDPVRTAARRTIVEKYSTDVLWPEKEALLKKIAEG